VTDASQTFAATAATIVSGAVAERAQLVSYLIYSTVISIVIYPIVVHWVWSPAGWLSTANPNAFLGGAVDFAGAGVVHLVGGIAALSGAAVIGPRQGRFVHLFTHAEECKCEECTFPHRCCGPRTENALPMPGHSSVLQALGTFILWMGWCARPSSRGR